MAKNIFGEDQAYQEDRAKQGNLFPNIIKSISYNQDEMIQNILDLHSPNQKIDCDITYSVGGFYRGKISASAYKFDIDPKSSDVIKASSDELPLEDSSLETIMYDPPFMSSGYKPNPTYKMVERFSHMPNMGRLWRTYGSTLTEVKRVLKKNGILIFKCQDCVDGRYNWFSHCEIMMMAYEIGLYPRDLFILLSKNRINTMQNQVHARKYHCYFWVFQNKPSYVKYGTGINYDYNEQPNKRGSRKRKTS